MACRYRLYEPLVLRSLNGNCIRLNHGKISIISGKETVYEIPEFPYSHIFITGRGFVSNDAVRVFSEKNIPITYLYLDGTIQSQLIHSINTNQEDSRIRYEQYETALNRERSMKIYNSIIDFRKRSANSILRRIGYEPTNDKLPEGIFIRYYFDKLLKHLSEKTGLPVQNRRLVNSLNYRATNKLNALLNFAYHLSEYQSRLIVIANGLDPKVGFFHRPYVYKEPLVYDTQELIRHTSELAILNIADNIKPNDFNPYGNREYRCNPELIEQVIHSFYTQYNQSVFGRQIGNLRKYICGQIKSLSL